VKVEEKFLLVSEAARILNRSAESVREYERSGKLPAHRSPSGVRLFRESDVQRLAKQLPRRATAGLVARVATVAVASSESIECA